MRLVGKQVVLRRPELKDAKLRFQWYSDPDVARYLRLAGKGPLSLASIEAYLSALASSDRQQVDFSIDSIDGQTIGCCSLRDLDVAHRAELSILIGESGWWGKGVGREVIELLINYGFRQLGLHAIWLVVRSDHARAIHLYQSIGFRHDGVMRSAALVNGQYIDKWLMSILAEEWCSKHRSGLAVQGQPV